MCPQKVLVVSITKEEEQPGIHGVAAVTDKDKSDKKGGLDGQEDP